MRTMDIPRFQARRSFSDLDDMYRERIGQRPCARATTSAPTLSYMAWPNNTELRKAGEAAIQAWMFGDGSGPEFRIIDQHWGRVADVVNLVHALREGRHQQSRGGASIGKAIFLASKRIKSRGAKEASLWRQWTAYKDVAHLITATIAVCADIQRRHRQRPFGIGLQELLPIRVVSLFPDLILALASTYQEYGLNEGIFDPVTLWRIPDNFNLESVPAPERSLPVEEVAILNARRAGSRGRANRKKTTLIPA